MLDVFKVAEILVSHAIQAHKGEIAIIAYYGSYATGLASPTSDLDIFYIPNDRKADSLSSQFVFDNLPYDFWPLSWEFAERIANAKHNWAIAASLIADAKVLYYLSQKDLDRFNALKARIKELMGPNGRKNMIQQALEEFKNTLFQLGQMRLAGNDAISMHWAGLKFVNSVVNCLALVNQTYFTKVWENNLTQISKMSQKPDGFEDMIREIITQKDTRHTLKVADRLAKEVRKILLSAQFSISEPSEPKDVFKDFYFFIFEYVNIV
ncbi:MAG: nucleotidyltransferase domain-containing protein [Kosmotoga sp.]|uniref:nucleotidyltransferase domain-containing protein n=1 Tax=Kosmotoga sp. TaxID=1955248 RepID=UPI0025BB75EB|nr:nucleotidyltransferase domain-containing protein [Kosmotoga sp.]MCD6160180.1 nucleotidyltransferase domain-containing protein [Kosmotoga sp.]